DVAGVKVDWVAEEGAGPAVAGVIAGHVDFMVAPMPGAIQSVRSGSLRALGVSSLARAAELADLPTIAESGLPGYDYVPWFGVFAPGTTPPALVARLNELLRQGGGGGAARAAGGGAAGAPAAPAPARGVAAAA